APARLTPGGQGEHPRRDEHRNGELEPREAAAGERPDAGIDVQSALGLRGTTAVRHGRARQLDETTEPEPDDGDDESSAITGAGPRRSEHDGAPHERSERDSLGDRDHSRAPY